jgi:DNA-binding LacI/PurR family transcriptional regulator
VDGKVSTREAVLAALKERIQAGEFPPGARLPSERALAAELKVSRISVQSALEKLEQLGYLVRQPNCRPVVAKAAESSARVHTARMVAVWIHPSLQELGAAMMLQGIRTVLGSKGLQLLVGCTPSLELKVVHQTESAFLRSLVTNPAIAGAIVWDTGSPAFGQSYRDLGEAGIPVVFIDREPSASIDADVVAANHRRAARNAVQHLIDLGHRKIAMVVNDDPASSVLDRMEGYCTALRQAEIPFRGDYLVRLPVAAGQTVPTDYESVIRRLICTGDAPTAVFAVNDQIASYVREVAKHVGLRIPKDLSLVGFDWLMRWLPSGGDLTTVSQPFEEIGRAAATRLLDRIESDADWIPRQILLDAKLLIRSTTAAPERLARTTA